MILEPHRHPGVFVAKGKEHLLVTRNLVPGDSVYGEKRISIEQPNATDASLPAEKVEYRVWNPFRSKLAAGILGGLDNIHVGPGKKVLYLGAASGTSVSHVADVVGPEGTVYAVEFSHRSGRDLVNMAKKRTNVIRAASFPSFALCFGGACADLERVQPSSRTPVTRTSTACSSRWSTSSLPTLPNPTRPVSSP